MHACSSKKELEIFFDGSKKKMNEFSVYVSIFFLSKGKLV